MGMSIQQKREKRQALAKELLNHHENNKHAWGGKDGENQKRYNTLSDQIMDLDLEIANEQRILDMEAQTAHALEGRAQAAGRTVDHQAEREREILAAWLRGGVEALSPEDRQEVRQRAVQAAMSTGVPAEGGYTVPREFSATLLDALKAFGGMREVATVMATATGAPFDHPTTDSSNEEGEIVAENAAATAQDFTFGTKAVGAYKFSSKEIAVPFELLQDSAINIEDHIRTRLALRIGRITNRLFTTGTGSGQPEGIVTASAVGVTGKAGQVTSFLINDLIDLEHSVDPAYRANGCGWMFHDDVLRAAKKLVDTQGRPLWLPGYTQGEPNTLMRYPYTINQHMPVPAANAKSILFGQFSTYLIRDVMQVMLFRMADSNFTRKGQVGFLAFSRHDGKLLDVGGAVKAYKHPAS